MHRTQARAKVDATAAAEQALFAKQPSEGTNSSSQSSLQDSSMLHPDIPEGRGLRGLHQVTIACCTMFKVVTVIATVS